MEEKRDEEEARQDCSRQRQHRPRNHHQVAMLRFTVRDHFKWITQLSQHLGADLGEAGDRAALQERLKAMINLCEQKIDSGQQTLEGFLMLP